MDLAMKQYTTKEQTQHLIELGFSEPKIIANTEVEELPSGLIHLFTRYDYSIGELIEFLEANMSVTIWYDGNYHYWYVDYDLRRVGIDKHLINALYGACVELKKEGVI